MKNPVDINTELRIVVCGYRDWAKEIICKIEQIDRVVITRKFLSYDEYQIGISSIEKDTAFILFLGWSWIIPVEITSRFLCLGIHPSDLPYYRGGSPIQHQIINGLTKSKVTLMTLSSEKLDGGDIWGKEDLDLNGDNMEVIFRNIVDSSVILLTNFIARFPNCVALMQSPNEGSYFKRRKSEDSRITHKDFKEKPLIEIYNKIRSLTDPYPNAYMEDELGNKLFFKEVTFIENEKKLTQS